MPRLTAEESSMERRVTRVRKRDGRIVPFDRNKIADAIFKAAQAVGGQDRYLAEDLAEAVTMFLEKEFADRIPGVEEIQDIVERVLIKTGHARTARAYILYRDRRARARRVRNGLAPADLIERAGSGPVSEVRHLSLEVRRSDERILPWDRQKVVESLVRETGIGGNIAEVIVLEVEEDLVAAKARIVSSAQVREMVNAKLAAYGLDDARRKYARLGVPVSDMRALLSASADDPDATSRRLGEHLKKEFALNEVFSQEIADSHLRGEIHVCGLERVDCFDSLSVSCADIPALLRRTDGGAPGEHIFSALRRLSERILAAVNGKARWEEMESLFAPLGSPADPASFSVGLREQVFLPLADRGGCPVRLIFSCRVSTAEETEAAGYLRQALDAGDSLLFPLEVFLPVEVAEKGLPAGFRAASGVVLTVCGSGKGVQTGAYGATGAPAAVLQSTSINLPALCASRAGGGAVPAQSLAAAAERACRSFLEKREFLAGMNRTTVAGIPAGKPACRLAAAGLREAVSLLTGKTLGEDEQATRCATELLEEIRAACSRFSQTEGIPLLVACEDNPSVNERLALLAGRQPYAWPLARCASGALRRCLSLLSPVQALVSSPCLEVVVDSSLEEVLSCMAEVAGETGACVSLAVRLPEERGRFATLF